MCQSIQHSLSLSFLNVLPTLASQKNGTNNNRMFTIISIHPSSYLPVLFFFLIKNGLNLHSYLLGLSALKHELFFLPSCMSQRALRTFVLMANK